MRNAYRLILGFGMIALTLLSLQIANTKQTTVGKPPLTDNILRSKIAFAVVGEEITRGLNLHTLSESDYYKMRGPVLLEQQTDIHFLLREQYGRIVNTVYFGAVLNTGSPSQDAPISPENRPVLYQKASEIIRDFIAERDISVIIVSYAPIGIGEIAAIRRLQGEVPYTYEIINSAAVSVPLKNIAALIKLPFITEIWPDSKGYLQQLPQKSPVEQIGADKIHEPPPNGLGITGLGVLVGVVDNGMTWDHDGEIKKIDPWIDRSRVKEIRSTIQQEDRDHGIVVARVIGAALHNNKIGVAPEVRFVDARRGYALAIGDGSYKDGMQALKWAADTDADILNFGDQTPDVINLSQNWEPWVYGRSGDDPMSLLINNLVEVHRIVVVNAAGNWARQRASGQINSTSDTKTHVFKLRKDLSKDVVSLKVTLLWDNKTNDLDLAVSGTSDTPIKSQGETEHGVKKLYEEVKFDAQVSETYTVEVQAVGQNFSSPQEYEIWLHGADREDIEDKYAAEFSSPNREKTVGVPGYSPSVITVGAVSPDNSITVYSSGGPSDTGLIKPEVVAPGTTYLTDGTSYEPEGFAQGTSFAAPYVAGVAALILDAVGKNDKGEWNFNPDEVKSAIVRGAQGNIGDITNTPNNIYGAGLVRADNIIFGGEVQPGDTLRYQVKYNRDKYIGRYNFLLNAENEYRQYDPHPFEGEVDYSVAIRGFSHDLDLWLTDETGKRLDTVYSKGLNYIGLDYIKLSTTITDSFTGPLFLEVHNPSEKFSTSFIGASTQPIVVWIPDPNLEKAIQQEIGDPITSSKLLSLKSLEAQGLAIKDLTGLESAHNLTDLNLSSNDISDISDLRKLTKLNNLDLSDNKISDSDISDLTKPINLSQAQSGVLTELNELDLSGNKISDASALRKLTNLSRLDLAVNNISNIPPLGKLTKLNYLHLSNNKISNISALAGLRNLSHLYLAANEISDISALSKLTQLKELWLSNNKISDISALAGLRNLSHLYLAANEIPDISAFSGSTTALRYLHLSNNSISDISALAGLTQLRELKLSHNSISDISHLVELGLLKHLNIRTNPLSYASVNIHIPAMMDKGVQVFFQNLTHAALMKISGDMQEGEAGTALTAPLVVEALDADGAAMTDISVTFSVVEGDGHISATTTTTDTKGRAQTTLTLGPNPGMNKVRVTAIGIIAPVTFTATTASLPEVEPDLPTVDKNTTKWGLPEGAKARLGKGLISEVAYSRDKKRVAVGTNIGAWLYDAESGEPLSLLTGHKSVLTGHRSVVEHVAFRQDNKILATAGTDKTVRLWDVATGSELAVLQHSGYYGVHDLAFSPDGTTLAVLDGRGLSLWDVTDVGAQAALSRETENTLEKETLVVGEGDVLAFSPDGGTLAVIGRYASRIYFVDMDTLTVGPRVSSDKSDESVIAAAFSPSGGTLATVGTDVALWDVASGTVKKHIDGRGGTSRYVKFSPDGTTLAFDRQAQVYGRNDRFYRVDEQVHFVHLFDIATDTVKASLKNRPVGKVLQSDAHVALDFNWDGTLHAVGTGIWDEGTEPWIEIENALNVKIDLFSLTGHIGVPWLGRFSPDGNTFATTNTYDTVWLWDVATSTYRHIVVGTNVEYILKDRFRIGSLLFSPDSTTLAVGPELWDVTTGTLKSTLHGSIEYPPRFFVPNRLAFSPDSTHILRGLGLYDVATGMLKTEYSVDNYDTLSRANTLTESWLKFSDTAFSLNGTCIAAISSLDLDRSGTMWLWDVLTDTLITTLPAHLINFQNFYIEFSPDGTIFVAKNPDGDAILWDVATGTEIGILPHLHDMSQIEAFSPDSTILVTEDYAARSMNFWDTETATQLYTISTYPSKGVFSPDGTIFATEQSGRVMLWDVATGGTLKVIRTPHIGQINDLDFSSDGTTLATTCLDGTVLFWEIEPSPPSTTETEVSPADVNGDGEVNIQDLVLVSSSLGQIGENNADVNGDGEVNIQDLVAVAAALGEVAAAPAALRQQSAAHLTQEEVQQWLTQAQQADLTDATSVRGIRFLAQLLSALTPKETALLPNYPNPFNPETWIPYQLATPAEVSLTIYDIQGRVVRDLDLGHQRAGMYHNRSRAAYWDGRNAVGEPVASGVYFYTLTAGEFSATRKLLIRK